jgi:hypothetical protein
MGEKSVKVVKLRCNQTDDDDVDEIFMFHNGGRIFPPSGVVRFVQGMEFPMDIPKDFGVPSAGWRIREMSDCASSPKTHEEALNQRRRSRL